MYRMILGTTAIVGLVLTLVVAGRNADGQHSGEDLAERTPDVVYVGTPYDVIDKMLEAASIEEGDVVYDLGCGDGRIVVAAARRYGCRGAGYDINPERVRDARSNVRMNRVDHLVTIREQDIFEVNLRPSSVIMLYLLPELNRKLLPQLETLEPGSRVVTHDYDLEGVAPDRVIEFRSLEDGVEHSIYVFKTPLRREDQ
jgi:SAM-dependent methyltransferase